MAQKDKTTPALSTGRALAAGGVLVIGLVVASSFGKKAPGGEPEQPAARAQDARSAQAKGTHEAPTTDAVVAAKREKTRAVWAGFDALPDEEKTKANLTDALEEAAEFVKAEPRTIDDRKLLEAQGIEFRRRAAPLAEAGARATGDRADVLVPPGDRERCVAQGNAWARDRENIAMLGFVKIECPGDPPRVWELKR